MKPLFRLLTPSLLLALLLTAAVRPDTATAQISVVVSSASSHEADAATIKDFFTGAKLKWSDKAPVQVVDQPGSAVGASFYSDFLGVPSAKLRVQWTKLVLSGQASAPRKAATDAEVRSAVAADPNAVGYIASDSIDDSVRELFRVE